MLTLYLICLILGGGLVVLSIFGGTDTDIDVDVDTAIDGEGLGAAAQFLSLRNVIFFVAFFGLTGTLLTMLSVAPLIAAPFAIGLGLVAAVSIHQLMRYLGDSESGEIADASTLAGTLADVTIEINHDHSGKVSVHHGDQTLQLVARRHALAMADRFGVGEQVVIVELNDGVAHVAGKRFLA